MSDLRELVRARRAALETAEEVKAAKELERKNGRYQFLKELSISKLLEGDVDIYYAGEDAMLIHSRWDDFHRYFWSLGLIVERSKNDGNDIYLEFYPNA